MKKKLQVDLVHFMYVLMSTSIAHGLIDIHCTVVYAVCTLHFIGLVHCSESGCTADWSVFHG